VPPPAATPPQATTVAEATTVAAPVPASAANVSNSPSGGSPSDSAVPASVPVDDDRQIRQVLERYRAAYEKLDARSAQQVWPTVNGDALARAFQNLASQNVIFEVCRIEVLGALANASCSGSARYVPRVGNREPRVEARSWDFRLRKTGTDWKIEQARADR
jgi:chorismate mutase